LGLSHRGTPDVAYAGDNHPGFAVYDSSSGVGWDHWGGTSAGAPQWASLIAIADQARLLSQGKTAFDGARHILPGLYKLPAADFNDIANGGTDWFKAGPGYDLVTGRGTPNADRIVADLVFGGGARPQGDQTVTVSVDKVAYPSGGPSSVTLTPRILIGADDLAAGLSMSSRTFVGLKQAPIQIDITQTTPAQPGGRKI